MIVKTNNYMNSFFVISSPATWYSIFALCKNITKKRKSVRYQFKFSETNNRMYFQFRYKLKKKKHYLIHGHPYDPLLFIATRTNEKQNINLLNKKTKLDKPYQKGLREQ